MWSDFFNFIFYFLTFILLFGIQLHKRVCFMHYVFDKIVGRKTRKELEICRFVTLADFRCELTFSQFFVANRRNYLAVACMFAILNYFPHFITIKSKDFTTNDKCCYKFIPPILFSIILFCLPACSSLQQHHMTEIQ
jgi:hypothetical protein